MKILFISNIFPPHVRGGYELGCLDLAEKYQDLGHSVLVATSENTVQICKYPEPKHIDVRRIFNPVRYYEDLYDYHFQNNSIYFYDKVMAFGGYIESNCIALKRLIELENPDLVWIFNPLGIGPIGILDTVISCKTKTVIHLMEHIDGVVQEYTRLVSLTGKWQYLKTKMTAISCSKKIYESNSLLGKYNINKVVYNWINFNKFFNQDYSTYSYEHERFVDNEEKEISKNKNIFRITYFGQIAEKKGILFLYDLAKFISKSPYKDKITIELFGRGEIKFMDALEKNIIKDDLSKIFILKGFLNKEYLLEKISYYDLAIFLLSDDEPFGYALIEAMLKGVTVMATEKTGSCELFQDQYDTIFIKDRKDIKEIYHKIVWCLENPSKLEEIRANAITTIKQNCDLDTVTILAFNEIIEILPINLGYSFEYVLSNCEILRYPYFDLNINPNLKGARYKFIDKVVSYLYNLPLIGKYLQEFVNNIVQSYRTNR
ncbi:MAG: glycosyltransferase family 4 protein [Nostoc sp.]|uniref:glycosyltransferase family 4 protein n=1 Tax=Nostoc sp. TaxID=1180 RepID=UPI002FF0C09B